MQPARLVPSRLFRRVAGLAAIALALACAETAAVQPGATAGAAEVDEAVEREVARIRSATAGYRSLDVAVADGYAREVARCMHNPPHGGMGYHHQNASLLDDRVQVERPEILLYERLPDGQYRLNGVEYIVPFSAWPRDRRPPTVMGQDLKPAPGLGLWYLHVWVWHENPSGLFADWNPRVRC